ncbi:phospholipase effector Tle1 domain-containing protein, partial [Escherichia coli]|uniref:phospholipase effector Tle1 domain-containing protein n=4 Tax=Pseudomonadota TaxID=1224 RepID=UPI00207CE1FF
MNIPRDVKRCAHFFSIHEQRMSFPLDTIMEGQAYPGGAGQRLEVAYPGVHSDVGGGYPPGDQGKARAGDADKLSQIPLHHMYIEALRWGVPLMLKDDIVRSQGEQHDFVLSSSVVNAFNAWLDKMGEISTVTDAMRIG